MNILEFVFTFVFGQIAIKKEDMENFKHSF